MVHAGSSTFRRETLKSMVDQAGWTENDLKPPQACPLIADAGRKPTTRVFVRAGKNLDDQVEAYQIIWGDIMEPVNPR